MRSKSIVAWMAGLGTPFGSVVDVVSVVTSSVAGVNFVLESFFGRICESIDWVLPSGAETVGPAQAAVATIAAARTALTAIRNGRLRIKLLLELDYAAPLPSPLTAPSESE